jgi:hypothetical protein
MGLEADPTAFVDELTTVFREVRRVLRCDGTLWLNLGDSYAGSGRGGNPTEKTSGLEGGQASQRASMVKRSRPANEIGTSSRDAAVTNFARQATRGSRLPAGLHETARLSGAIGRAWVPPATGFKQKDLMGMPWRVAFALQADGWYLRQDIIWSKPNPMPESVTDRCTKAHEYLFLMTKSYRYYYDAESIKEESVTDDPRRPYGSQGAWDMDGRPPDQRHGGKKRAPANVKRGGFNGKTNEMPGREAFRAFTETRNKRSVWTVATAPYADAHFATFPPALIEPCIKAGASERGCCAKCGSPWVRQTDREQISLRPNSDSIRGSSPSHSRAIGQPQRGSMLVKVETVGWEAFCDCGADVVPCTVLDPFLGAGTTALVADRLGRNCIGIELNPEYAAMAERRIHADAGMFAEVAVG